MKIKLYTILFLAYKISFTQGLIDTDRCTFPQISLKDLTVDTSYYSNGNPYIITRTINGKREGQQEWFYTNGSYWKIYHFVNDSLTGQWIRYSEETGKAELIGFYCYNKPIGGLWIFYHPNGKHKSEGLYCGSQFINLVTDSIGKRLEYLDDRFVLVKSIPFDQEIYDSLILNYGIGDNYKFLIFPIEIYIKDEEWKYFSENGILIKTETYSCGILQKTLKHY